ncbi:MAG: ABC transporter permease, partial [Roseomonas mucosa]|nr:ABC transporter permease [Roseomonas mucosa]
MADLSLPAAAPAPSAGIGALLKHARYVLAGNPVTAFSFGLFVFLLLCAILGPSLVPYDPLASDTSQALSPPSAAHWFGTDHLGRDILSRVVVATRLDMSIAVFSVALVFALGG